ncbi:hypothetical protein V8P49_17445 [Acinetobacter baumannii]
MSRTRIPVSVFSAYRYNFNDRYTTDEDKSLQKLNSVSLDPDILIDIEKIKHEFKVKNTKDLLSINFLNYNNSPLLNVLLLKEIRKNNCLNYKNLLGSNKDELLKRLLSFSISEFEDLIYFLFLIKYDLVSFLGERNRFIIKKIKNLDYYSFLQEEIVLIKEMLLKVEDLFDYENYKIKFIKKLATSEFKFNLIFYDLCLIEKLISNYFIITLLDEDITIENMIRLVGFSIEIDL